MNEALVVSDGIEARLGALTAGWEWFKPWYTIGSRRPSSLPTSRGPDISPDVPKAGRADYSQDGAVTPAPGRPRSPLNSSLPVDALNDALSRLTRPEGSTLEALTRGCRAERLRTA